MGGACMPSGGVNSILGRTGKMPYSSKIPNSRTDMYNEFGKKIQSRWYDWQGQPIYDRDFKHGNNGGIHEFPHDHRWVNGVRNKKPELVDDSGRFC